MLQWVQYSNSIGFNFNGRARRSEFWYNYLFYMIISVVTGIVTGIIDAIAVSNDSTIIAVIAGLISTAVSIFVFIKMLPVTVRRFHDVDKSGWMYLICLLLCGCCGIGGIIFIIFMCKDSTPGPNQYGNNPKETGGYQQNYGYGQQNMGGYQQGPNNYNQNPYGNQNMNNQGMNNQNNGGQY